MSKKNWISVKRGLSEDPKHRQAMGEAIWLFLHIVDAADWETGKVYDWRDKEIAIDMSLSTATVRGWRDRLSDNGYITCKQVQHGLEIIIHNWVDPRNYSGKKMNSRQGDTTMSPSENEEMQENPQGESQVDIQVIDKSRVNDASLIESTSTSESESLQPSKEEPSKSATLKEGGRKVTLPAGSGLDWKIAAPDLTTDQLEAHLAKEAKIREVTNAYESAMGYNPLEWAKLDRLQRFLLTKTVQEIQTFAKWSRREFSTFTPAKARQNPNLVIDLWPQAFTTPDTTRTLPEKPDTRKMITPEMIAEARNANRP